MRFRHPCLILAALLVGCEGPATAPAPEPAQIQLSETSITLDDAAIRQLTATVLDREGRPLAELPGGAQLVWSSRDTIVATVQRGEITARRPGKTEIRATVGTASAAAQVTVNPVPTLLERVRGQDQTGTAGQPLPDSLVVRVLDRHLSGVPGVAVEFVARSGESTLAVDTVVTNAGGHARKVWTLGPKAGEQTVDVRVPAWSFPGVRFVARAAAGTPSRLERVGGDGQSGEVGSELTQPLAVRVTDGSGNPVAGAPVTWTARGGAISPAISTTDSVGIARAAWTLGDQAGAQEASAAGAGAVVRFVASATPPAAARVVVSPESLTMYYRYNDEYQLEAKVYDQAGRLLSGAPVTWSVADTSVAYVHASGKAGQRAPGQTVIIARSGAAADTVRVRVRAADLTLHGLIAGETLSRTSISVSVSIRSMEPDAWATAQLDSGEEQRPQRFRPFVFAGLTNGPHVLTIRVYDARGNKIDEERYGFRVEASYRRYSVRYLGTLGGPDSRGLDLNNAGDAVGWAQAPGGSKRAVLWSKNGAVDLGAGLQGESEARAINATGEIVGTYEVGDCPLTRAGTSRVVRWSAGGEGPRPVTDECARPVVDINDAGDVIYAIGRKLTRLSGGERLELPHRFTNPDVPYFVYNAWINGRGQILGVFASGYKYDIHTVLWPESGRWEVQRALSDIAIGFNDNGDHISRQYYDEKTHAYIGGSAHRILGMGTQTPALADINNRSQVVGAYSTGDAGNPSEIFLWEGGTNYAVEPTDTAWDLDHPAAINDAGVILAHGRNRTTGQQGAVLLTPLP
jgi:hypothetical protein